MRPVVLLSLLHHVKHFWLENVHPGVDCVTENLGPRRFLEETNDLSVRVSNDNAKFQWTWNSVENKCGNASLRFVESNGFVQIHIGHRVARNDDKCVVSKKDLSLFDATCGAKRSIFDGIFQIHPKIRTIIKVACDLVGKVVERGDNFGDSVGL